MAQRSLFIRRPCVILSAKLSGIVSQTCFLYSSTENGNRQPVRSSESQEKNWFELALANSMHQTRRTHTHDTFIYFCCARAGAQIICFLASPRLGCSSKLHCTALHCTPMHGDDVFNISLSIFLLAHLLSRSKHLCSVAAPHTLSSRTDDFMQPHSSPPKAISRFRDGTRIAAYAAKKAHLHCTPTRFVR